MEEKDRQEIVRLLDGLSMADVVASDTFRSALRLCLDVELGTLEKVRSEARRNGRHIKSNPIDRLRDDGAFSVARFSELFIAIVDKRCMLPATLRGYIRQVCMKAYYMALRAIVDERRRSLDSDRDERD